MRLIELEITNLRGICDLHLKPEGRNMVIWGPNGSGKSAVVDALDFLLTGQISRLKGQGTRGISLDRHGPHVGNTPDHAEVRAIIDIPGIRQPIQISRCIARPKELTCDPIFLPHVLPVLQVAERGQHILTRRDILRYVTAEAGTRAEQIQALLNIGDVEEIRRTLVKVENDLESNVKSAKRTVNAAEAQVCAAAGLSSFKPDKALEVINRQRAVLGGGPITNLGALDAKAALAQPAASAGKQPVNLTMLHTYLSSLRNVTSNEYQLSLQGIDKQLRELIASVRCNPVALRAVSRMRLTTLGLELLDPTGNCPLCETTWEPGALAAFLQRRQAEERVANVQHCQITDLAKAISDRAASATVSIDKLLAIAEAAELGNDRDHLRSWHEELLVLAEALVSPLSNYPCPAFPANRLQRLLAPDDLIVHLNQLQTEIESKFPETTPEQTAWDTLTRLEEHLSAVERAKTLLSSAEHSYGRARALRLSFEKARDDVLAELYSVIRSRFVDLYRDLHHTDEPEFAAIMEPDGAGLKLEVDFYGHGTHPPHALHSEGHQDSMGLCLYLALAEHLDGGNVDLLILDDVVMSVDADHRRELCRMLAEQFPRRQFLITTHDKTWAGQLRSEGIVSSNESIEFYNWHLDTGPQISNEADLWERIAEAMQKNDIATAAARLRRGSEDYFRTVCGNLHAPVAFKPSGQWELGDFLPAAMNQYQTLIRRAKSAANSWNDTLAMDQLIEVSSTAASVFKRTQAEQWAVNANVHYNSWASFTASDFQPVLQAFQDLFLQFTCSECNTVLRVTTDGPKFQNVKCSCGKVTWNLAEKGK